ncbi:GNAT family N-acetyltransferase [Streptomyces sp. NPDC058274]|uniref:GNAT family N-acetyltransferase n=1 Tax=Streptomyces sp. NPDC058274 TaxID=3346416 RepID=UPI0036E6A900
MDGSDARRVRLEPWGEGDFWVLQRNNTPEMTEHLGGPETAEQLVARHRRYVDLEPGRGQMYRVTLADTSGSGTSTGIPGTSTGIPGTSTGIPGTSIGVPGTSTGIPGTSTGIPGTSTGVPGDTVGSIGFWERAWRDGTVWETGWAMWPEFQGRGLAAAAARAVAEAARATGRNQYLHAFPGVDHPASNAVCRKAGFELLGPVEFEYPKGHWITSNDWRVDLSALRARGDVR